jgi:hypothetical protein
MKRTRLTVIVIEKMSKRFASYVEKVELPKRVEYMDKLRLSMGDRVAPV